MSKEARKFPRIDSLNFTYFCLDEDGEVVSENMGRTLNVSETGICLETHIDISPRYHLLITLALEDELLEVRGKVVFCRPGEGGMYETGVEFEELDEKSRQRYQQYINHFQGQGG